jgi:hypothetical protein
MEGVDRYVEVSMFGSSEYYGFRNCSILPKTLAFFALLIFSSCTGQVSRYSSA